MLAGPLADIVAEHGAATQTLREQIDRWVQGYWASMGTWRTRDIDRMAVDVTRYVEAAQHRMGALTDLYLARVLTEMSGERQALVGVSAAEASTVALRGVPGADVYKRPGATLWTALREGEGLDSALGKGKERLRKIAATNMQLAKTHTALRVMLDSPKKVQGYRRVLIGSTNCALCIVASTARYHRGDLQPIHPGCDCSVLPMWGDKDPGWVIDNDQLANVHDTIERELGGHSDAARTFTTAEGEAIAYRDILVTRQHGEIGPVLTDRRRPFKGPSDI